MKTSHQSLRTNHYSLTLGWLYPELMSTYGDRGNIIVLQKRAEWRGINIIVERINQTINHQSLAAADILFMGGAQDIQQEIVQKDLNGKKGKIIKDLVEGNTPGLFICGAYQFLGNYYKDAYGTEIKGLGVFNMFTESRPDENRLIGNIIIKPKSDLLSTSYQLQATSYLTGFENHGGRTYLTDKTQAFAKVIKGYGNNGEDMTEGIHFKSTIGTYLHGPILPSNPQLADYFIESALVKKYGEELKLEKLDDTLSEKAKMNTLRKLKAGF